VNRIKYKALPRVFTQKKRFYPPCFPLAFPLPKQGKPFHFMTLAYFKSLTRNEKKLIVLRNGSFLSEKNYGFFRTMLYQVDGFYVEIYFTKFSKDAIWFRNFDSTKNLHPYLQQIDISGLFQDMSISR
jgi:hypothetical protein